ncbi:hypothetical protein ACIPW4_22345 [Pseudomonas sp. NPDC089996]
MEKSLGEEGGTISRLTADAGRSKSQKRQNPYLHAQIGVLRNES